MKKEDSVLLNLPTTPALRLDVWLSTQLKITRSQAQKLINRGVVRINGKTPIKAGQKINIHDQIILEKTTLNAPAAATLRPTQHFTYRDIVFIKKTSDYFIVDKPAGMLTHSTSQNEPDSLAALIATKFPAIKKVGDDPARPGIVHRLDKEASGLLIIARTPTMFEYLKTQFKNKTIDKEYLVLVHGKIVKEWDEINFRLERSRTHERMAAIPTKEQGRQTERGKTALTEFVVEKKFINFTFLRVKIRTGRMHQIRAHLLAYNHPLVGDPLYLQKKQKRIWDERLGRLFLHCHHLAFMDTNGRNVSFESPLPVQLKNFLTLLK